MKEMICIVCPRGCHLQIDDHNNVSGNFCKRGVQYAINEMTHPSRMVTSTVKIKSEYTNCLPVITSGEVPKDKMFDVIEALKEIEVTPPIYVKEVVIKNVLNLGVDIVATRTLLK